jgi:hypothetical protein
MLCTGIMAEYLLFPQQYQHWDSTSLWREEQTPASFSKFIVNSSLGIPPVIDASATAFFIL